MEVSPSVSDEEGLRLATSHGTLLVAEDKDFGELIFRRRLSHAGVMLIRLEGLGNAEKAEVVSRAVQVNGAELIGALSGISTDSIRMRRPEVD